MKKNSSSGSISADSTQQSIPPDSMPQLKLFPQESVPKPTPNPKVNQKTENLLLTAAQFVSAAQPVRSNTLAESHCRLFAKQITACSNVLSAGMPIQDDIECCPHTQKFVDALKECPEAINLTLLPTTELSIKSGNFQAVIPCIPQNELPAMFPDPPQYPVTIDFQQALISAGKLVNDRNRVILFSSVKLLNESITATNGDVIMEVWHGQPSPVGICPKLFIKAIQRTRSKAFYNLGNSEDTITAHFSEGGWLKTKLQYDPEFPDLQQFLVFKGSFQPTPHGFWSAVERLAPFSKDERIYFRKEGLCTDEYQTDGAINLCEGLPHGISFSIPSLRLIEDFAETIAFNVTTNMSYFLGKNIRGAIAQRSITE